MTNPHNPGWPSQNSTDQGEPSPEPDHGRTPDPGAWPPAPTPTEERPTALTAHRPWPTGQTPAAAAPNPPTTVMPAVPSPAPDPEIPAEPPNSGQPPRYPANQPVIRPPGTQRTPSPPANGHPRHAEPRETPSAPNSYRPPAPRGAENSDDETAWSPTSAAKAGPTQGWRGGLAKVGIKLAKSARELEYDRDVHRIRRKLAYPQNVLVVALKGGVGKSSATITLGSTLAQYRHVSDVVAFDSATDGSLRRRMPAEQNRSVTSDTRHFLRSIEGRPLSGSEVQVQLYSNPAGLQTLAAGENIADYTLSVDEFHRVLAALHREYMVNIIDTGPDRRVPTFWPAVQAAHAVVLVTTPSALSIANTKRFIDLLRESECKHLLSRTVLLWNNAAPGKEVSINVDATKSYLVRQLSQRNDASTCLVEIPLDPHLATSGEIYLSSLEKHTRRQFERAAALLMDKLPNQAVQR